MASSVYTASIAAIALMQILIIIKIFEVERHLPSSAVWNLVIGFVLASVLVVSNRFETTVFYSLAVAITCLRFWKNIDKRIYAKLIIPIYLVITGTAIGQNKSLQAWIGLIIKGEAKVLSVETARSSVVVDKIGDLGLTVTAPLTFFDNSSRILYGALGDSADTSSVPFNILIIVSWIPLVCLFSLKLLFLFRPLLRSFSYWRTFLVRSYPALFVIGLFIVIPFFTRTIWFLHYAIPLLCVFLLFTESMSLNRSFTRVLFGLGVLCNVLTFYVVSFKNGDLYIADYIFGVKLQIGVMTGAVFLVGIATLLKPLDTNSPGALVD
jgi:hypothetical protein